MTTGWAAGPMLAFDVESTGVDTATDRIVTASIVTIQPGHPTHTRSWLINPGVVIPQGAIDVHGITNDMAHTDGADPAPAVLGIAEALTGTRDLCQHDGPVIPIVAMNAPFDLSMLNAELRRHHNRGLTLTRPVLDPLILDRHAERYRRGKRALTALCEHYRIPLTEAHSSDADALAAARVTWRIAKLRPHIAAMTLDELQDAQTRWHSEQQHSFAHYLRTVIAHRVLTGAGQLTGNDRAAKLTELPGLLARADHVDSEAGNWPLKTAP